MYKFSTCLLAAAMVACASDPGTRPQDMSAAEHRSAAKQDDATAAAHDAQYDPAAVEESKGCAQSSTITGAFRGPPCWTSRTNPTTEHAEEAKRYRELAEKHRRASAALVQAEQQACTGIDPQDRDMSPFFHREDIVSVAPAHIQSEAAYSGGRTKGEAVGATIVLRAVPGLTREWLERVIACHRARAAAVGHEMPEMSRCPLMLKQVSTVVSSAEGAFAVQITSEDHETAKEILRRAQALRN